VRVEITAGTQVVTVTLPRSEYLELGLRLDDVVSVREASLPSLAAA
jgi:hypothetical protein